MIWKLRILSNTRFDNFWKVVKSNQIDFMEYHLYDLNYQEACVIDNDLKIADFEQYKIWQLYKSCQIYPNGSSYQEACVIDKTFDKNNKLSLAEYNANWL